MDPDLCCSLVTSQAMSSNGENITWPLVFKWCLIPQSKTLKILQLMNQSLTRAVQCKLYQMTTNLSCPGPSCIMQCIQKCDYMCSVAGPQRGMVMKKLYFQTNSGTQGDISHMLPIHNGSLWVGSDTFIQNHKLQARQVPPQTRSMLLNCKQSAKAKKMCLYFWGLCLKNVYKS